MLNMLYRKDQTLPLVLTQDMVVGQRDTVCSKDGFNAVRTNKQEQQTVTKWFDANGFECDASEAEFKVIGPFPNGDWCTIELGEYVEH